MNTKKTTDTIKLNCKNCYKQNLNNSPSDIKRAFDSLYSVIEFREMRFGYKPKPSALITLREIIDFPRVTLKLNDKGKDSCWVEVFPIQIQTSSKDIFLLNSINSLAEKTNGIQVIFYENSYGYPILKSYQLISDSLKRSTQHYSYDNRRVNRYCDPVLIEINNLSYARSKSA